jgi:predicted transcriptional regulator
VSRGGRRFCLPMSSRKRSDLCYLTIMSEQPTDSTKEAGSNVFSLAAIAKPKKRKDKWPDAVLSRGYSMIPSILLLGQAKMGLKPDELNVLLQLISHWWSADHDPHPAKDTIARRMGKDARTVQRHLTTLETKGFIKRVERFKRHKGQDSNGYDLSGLIAKLEAIAPEFEKVTDQNKRRRAKAETKTA